MKNIFKNFLIIFITFSLILSINIISNAENELVEEDYEPETVMTDEDDIILDGDEDYDFYDENDIDDDEHMVTDYSYEKNYFSISSNNVNVDQDVYGDAFICTSGTATIDSAIYGNVFICASKVEITEYAEINCSLFIVSESSTILGSIYGNVYSVSRDFNLGATAYLDLDLFVTSQNVNIEGSIYRDANISGDKIAISDTADIDGDLNYSSEKEINIPEGIVNGNVNYSSNINVQNTNNKNAIKEWFLSTISYIIFAIVLFIICKWINCKFINAYPDFVSNLPKYLLYGILGIIAIPIVAIILLAIGITMSLSFILLSIYFILMLIASSSVIITLSSLCAEKLKEKLNINDTLRTILFIAILSIVYELLQLIPILGTIVTFAFVILGFGLLIKSALPSKQ